MVLNGGEMSSPVRDSAPALFTESPLRSPFGPLASPIPLFQPSPLRAKRLRTDEPDADAQPGPVQPGADSVQPGQGGRGDDGLFSRHAGIKQALPDSLQVPELRLNGEASFVFGSLSQVPSDPPSRSSLVNAWVGCSHL